MSDKTVLVVDDDTAHATMLKTLMKGWGYTYRLPWMGMRVWMR